MFLIVIKKKYILYLYAILIILISSVIYSIFHTAQAISFMNGSKNNSEYYILIYAEEKRLYLFKDNKLVKEYPIATGTWETPSPIGQWKIIKKGGWGEGFGGYWLGLNVSWGDYGIHGTMDEWSIGYSASHGCIRMLNKDIKELYETVSIGTPVTIMNGTFGPFGTGFRMLIPGNRGADVLAVQQKLKKFGYFKGYENGIYEENLKYALFKFQKDNNLPMKNMITYEDYHAMGFREFE